MDQAKHESIIITTIIIIIIIIIIKNTITNNDTNQSHDGEVFSRWRQEKAQTEKPREKS